MQGKRPVNLAVAGDVVVALHVPIEALVVVVIPKAAARPGVPWQGPQNLTTARKLVEGKLAFEEGVMLQDNPHIVNGGLGQARLGVHGQLAHPVGGVLIVGAGDALKVLHGLLVALLAHQGGHILVLHGQLTHGLVGGQAVGGSARLGLIVLVPKAVEADHIKGIDQTVAARVGGVVGIEEFAVVVDDSAAGGGAAQVGVAARHIVHRLIDAGDELIHGPVDVIGAAESAHHAGLALWVALLDGQLGQAQSARHLGPGGAVGPVIVFGQQAVGREQRLVFPHIDVLAVSAAGRPIHEAGHLKGGGVHELQAYVLRHFAGTGLILIRRHGPVRGEQNTQAGSRRAVLTGGIDAIAAAQGLHPAQDILRAPGGDVVQVQGDDITPGHIVGFAPGPGQCAGHKAAHILEVILLGLFHIQICRQGFRASGRGLEPGPQL